jgi:predicted DNA-binding antitoxin AbrB/MazE fold protein
MDQTIKAVYEKGVLRPLQPLDLKERQAVRIQIMLEQGADVEAEAVMRSLAGVGLVTLSPGQTDAPQTSRDERIAVADRLGCAPGKALSEIIIEDRGNVSRAGPAADSQQERE